jgi:LysM repeat protein
MRFFWAWVLAWSLVSGATLTTYTVKQGDNLTSIARNHAMTINEVLTANNLAYGSLLKIGQQLKVYGYQGKTQTYRVKPGDSPLSLARRFHMPLLSMIRLNEIDFRRQRLVVGERIRLRRIVAPIRIAKKAKTSRKFHVASNSFAEKIVRDARRYLGIRYRWGGNNPRHGIDCSRFAQLVFKKQGITLPRVSGEQYRYALRHGKRVSMRQARKGDLIFFRTRHRRIGHVGIIIDPKKHLFQQSSSGAGRNNIRRYDIGSYHRRLRGIVHMNIASRQRRHAAHRS